MDGLTDLRQRASRNLRSMQSGVVQLGEHALLSLGAGDSYFRPLKVSPEALDHACCVQTLEYVECMGEVEQIAPLVALKQRAELGRQHLLAGER
jgi:hypothetical protein